MTYQSPGSGKGFIELRPQRGRLRPVRHLYDAAHLTGGVSAGVVEAFGVALQLSPWISGQLVHYRDNPPPDPLEHGQPPPSALAG